jgi:hypothetical protein
MRTVPLHAPWCSTPDHEHAACRFVIAEIDTGAQRLVVALHQARSVAPIITVISRVGAAEHLITLNIDTGHRLSQALRTGVELLH